MTTEQKIREALDDLATGPEPAGLADRALRGGVRQRRLNLITGSAAGVAVLALAGVGALQLFQGGAGGIAPGGRPSTAPCIQYTSGSNGSPEVPEAQWPDIVAAAVAALPPRSDYSMQSGYVWCEFPGGAPGVEYYGPGGIAYAVVNLGQHREAGHLTMDVFWSEVPSGCVEATADSHVPVLFCDEAVDGSPLVAGFGDSTVAMAIAIYPDGTSIRIASYGPEAGVPTSYPSASQSPGEGVAPPTISAEQLGVAVRDPALYEVIPLDVGRPR